MNGFIASPSPPASPADSEISGGAFWPAIDVNRFRDSMRIGNQLITHPRVCEALLGAMIMADDNLADWRTKQEVAGHTTLEQVPAPTFSHGVDAATVESRLVILWRRAVHAFAAADLIETHLDVSATKTGAAQGEVQALTPDDHRRNAIHAIRTIIGERRTVVELI